jgi:hypothetical protein
MTIWRIRFAYWIANATNTHSQNVQYLFHFSLQQRVQKCHAPLCSVYTNIDPLFTFLFYNAYLSNCIVIYLTVLTSFLPLYTNIIRETLP